MKYFVIGLLLWFTALLPGSVESAESVVHRLLPFEPGSETAKADENWKVCGNYFASIKTMGGNMVHFTFEKKSSSKVSIVFTFAMLSQLVISIDKNMTSPIVMVSDDGSSTKFFLVMNVENYKVGLPCLGRGMEI